MGEQRSCEADSTRKTADARRVAETLRIVRNHSPYLTRLLQHHPQVAEIWQQQGSDAVLAHAMDAIASDGTALPVRLRRAKAQLALGVALADIAGEWDLAQVTQALSRFAEQCVRQGLRAFLQQACVRGEFAPPDLEAPEAGSGIIILAVGKLGAHELNYSSDIDLVIFFDKETLPYCGARNAQVFMNKLASELTQLLQDRTSDGYVFRTDLRLRPDPMSTPLAVTTAAALAYYETVGQNWERAAMIKARPIAGDMRAAESFLRELVPFIWRKTLDFATIADIHSIKRQMNVGQKEIVLPGHNIKTGIGGIREIEFHAATLQLVWGGRIPELRVAGTLPALRALCEYDLIPPEARDVLIARYHYLRQLEHRLQMRDDAQTHTLPEQLHDIAQFMGMQESEFATETLATLRDVHRIYAESMLDAPPLAVDGNLVFTGVEADPDTLQTLARLGYGEAQRVSDIIQSWHRGHRRSTRSKRARQVLTELVPSLLVALGKTANPDAAFFHFDDFLGRLPSGAQIFPLLHARPELLELLADILGSAPALGETLATDPSLLEAVLEVDFFHALPSKQDLQDLVIDRLRYSHDYEQKMGYLRIFNNEKRFQAGVHLLKHIANPKRIGSFLSDLAEVVLQVALQEVWSEYARSHAVGTVQFAVLAFGKLGARGITFNSDIDIIFLYDAGSDEDGEARAHLHRISQRLISALTLLTKEGRLYEVDTRLRPGGSDGPLATHLTSFDQYFEQSAWTYEFMALTKARVVASNDAAFADRVEQTVRKHALKPHEPTRLLADVVDMRARIAKEFPRQNPWAVKHVRGGMVDLDFIAQYLVLRHAHLHPELWHRSSRRVFETASSLQLLDAALATQLVDAKKFLADLMSLLRLSAPGGVIDDNAPPGLKRLLVQGMGAADFDALKQQVEAMQARVRAGFDRMEQQNLGA